MTSAATPLYLALLPAPIVCPPSQWRAGLAVYYAPGSVSVSTGETLSYCFLERGTPEPYVWSGADARMNGTLARRAQNLLDQVRNRLAANLPPEWPGHIRSEMRVVAKKLYRLRYFEPEQRFVAAMLAIVERGDALSEKQLAVVNTILRERGAVDALRHRQHTQWRLMRLAEVDLTPDDRATVMAFRQQACEPEGLAPQRLPVIGALEIKYQAERLATTLERATPIAAQMEEEWFTDDLVKV